MPTAVTRDDLDAAFDQVRDLIAKWQASGQFREGQSIGLDFDGPLHGYREGWKDGTVYDEPAPFAREAVEFLGRYWDVPIFTARANIPDAVAWLREHGFPPLQVTNRKPVAIAYVDDRAVRWRNWPQAVIDLAALVLGGEKA